MDELEIKGFMCVYMLIMCILGLAFLISCIKNRKELDAYVKYAVFLALIIILMDLSVLLFVPDFFSVIPLWLFIILDLVAFVKITLCACIGMFCCAALQLPDIPLIKTAFAKTDMLKSVFTYKYLIYALALPAAGILYTFILFNYTSPQISSFVTDLAEFQKAKFGITANPSIVTLLAVVQIAFAEEILFRLGIQNFLAKTLKLNGKGYWIAIILTSIIWTLGHGNILEPAWVKLAQIFPLGLALGWLFKKYGLECCFLAHGLLNIAAILLNPYLLE